jgi:hypothetical protein
MMQAFKNQNKILVLTQSLTIQRISQRFIFCMTNMFSLEMKLYLRNIIQVYVQSAISLNRNFYVQSYFKLIKLMRISADCILKVIKSLYEMFEIDNHWFKTYHTYHIDNLVIIQFTYDLCLLYKTFFVDKISNKSIISDLVEMQIDDTLLLTDQTFVVLKKETIKSAKIMIKNRERLISENLLKFNEIRIDRLDSNEIIHFRQKTHI